MNYDPIWFHQTRYTFATSNACFEFYVGDSDYTIGIAKHLHIQ